MCWSKIKSFFKFWELENYSIPKVIFFSLLLYVVLVAIFAFVFCYCVNEQSFGHKSYCEELGFWDFAYFSFVTITTLGYGDIYPLGTIPRLLVCLETVTGLIGVAVYLSVIIRIEGQGPMTPKSAKKEYYSKNRKKIRKMQKKYLCDKELLRSKLRKKAEHYETKAKQLWGRDIRHREKSAWFYVLAAKSYMLANRYEADSCMRANGYKDAGDNFHFAAHEFRELGRQDDAGKYYHKAAQCFKKAGKLEKAIRSAKRAIAVYRRIEEHEEADKLRLFLRELEKLKNTQQAG